MTSTVLVAGGGTAGHVFPALAVATELTRLGDVEPVFVGVPGRLEARLVPRAGFRLHEITAVSVPRRPSPRLFTVPFAVRRSVRECERIVRVEGAAATVTFGGYVSFPLDRAAKNLGLPLVIHEQNAVPGLTNRIASRWADRVAVTFPGSADRFPHPERCAVTGDPVREELLHLDRSAERAGAREALGLAPEVPTLLVFGGSQGARSLNRAVIEAHPRWNVEALQILHAAGRTLHDEARSAWEPVLADRPGIRVEVVDFIDDMARAYAAADVVVCRAGATSIAELSVLGLPAVLVPYPHATGDHQTLNARALEQTGGAAVVEDRDLDGAALVAVAEPLLTDTDQHRRMSTASRAFGRPDAAANVARLVLEQLEKASDD